MTVEASFLCRLGGSLVSYRDPVHRFRRVSLRLDASHLAIVQSNSALAVCRNGHIGVSEYCTIANIMKGETII